MEHFQGFLGKGKVGLGLQQLDVSDLHFEHDGADGVEELELGGRYGGFGYVDAALAFGSAFEDEIGANAVFGRACHVFGVVTRRKQIQVVAIHRQDRVRPQSGGNDTRLRRRECYIFLRVHVRFLSTASATACCRVTGWG